jgi:hypothetical protein
VRRGAERALAEADATIASLRRDVQRLEEENSASVLHVVEISRELQEARDSEAGARVLRRQRVQMFRGFSAHIMAAAHRLGIHGLNLEEVLQRPSPPPPGTPDRAAVARAGRLDIALRRLQAIYARPGAAAATDQESSSSGDTSGSRESGSEEAREEDDGVTESSGEASSSSSQGTSDDEGDAAVA